MCELKRNIKDSSIKKHHILKKKGFSCYLGSHHLISFQFFEKISTERLDQMRDHLYDWDGGNNIIIIPQDNKNSDAKKISCYYRLPFHSGGHDGEQITKHWDENKKVNNKIGDFKKSNSQSVSLTKKEKNILTNDLEDLKNEKFLGYHKVILGQFIDALKKLKCKQTSFEYQMILDTESLKICKAISNFTLLLSNPGYNFSKDGVGCMSNDCEGRKHETNVASWPVDIEKVKAYMYKNSRLNTLKELTKKQQDKKKKEQ